MTACGRIRLRVLACVALALGVTPLAAVGEAKATESHALAMHGAPALPPDFTHMPYANPDAPKGGRLVWGLLGTFDSLNPADRPRHRRSADQGLCGREPDGARQ